MRNDLRHLDRENEAFGSSGCPVAHGLRRRTRVERINLDYTHNLQRQRSSWWIVMAEAHRRRFDAVIVWKFDRFARSVSHLLRALETFKALGIEFVSYSEQMDTSTPTGKMIFTVLGAVGELERSLIVERVRAGLRNARAKGKRLGRPRVAVNPSQIASLRQKGFSWAAIGEQLNVGEATVYRIAQASSKNPAPAVVVIHSKCGAD